MLLKNIVIYKTKWEKMNHISKHRFEYALLILGVLFYLINIQIPLMSDDILYAHIFPNKPLDNPTWGVDRNAPIQNFYDILISQYHHYFLHGGRVPVHIIIQSFCALFGRDLFNIITVGLFLLFIIFLGKVSMGTKNYAGKIYYFLPFMFFFLSIVHPKCFYSSIACSVNYLWSSVFCLSMWYYYTQKTKLHEHLLIPFCLLSFIAGWSHEGIVIPLSIALISYWICEVKKIRHWKTVAILFFCIGAALLIFAPGNFVRSGGGGGYSAQSLFIRELLFFSLLRVFYFLILFFLYAYMKFGKEEIKRWISQNKHLILGLLLSIPIFMCIGPTAPRVGFGIDLISAILLGSLINLIISKMNCRIPLTCISILSVIVPIAVFSSVLYYQINASKQIAYITHRVENEKSNIVRITIKNETPSIMSRFIQQYTIKEHPNWIKSVWEFKYQKAIELIEP